MLEDNVEKSELDVNTEESLSDSELAKESSRLNVEKLKLQPLKRIEPNTLFYLDETVTIKGNRFKVRKITKKEITLRLEPTRENQ
jgi:hypothetical protein